MKLYIGIDLGTSAMKLLLMDGAGQIKNVVSKEYPLEFPQPGWSQQAPEDWKKALLEGIPELLKGFDPALVAGIGAGGQMHGLVVLDESDNVIRPAILWNDGRTAKQVEYLNGVIGKDKLSAMTANIAFAGFTAPKILWMQENEPENFARIAKIMLPKDYINYILTGVHSCDYSDASGMLLDVEHKCWSAEMLKICGVRESQMPKLFESYDCIGTVKLGGKGYVFWGGREGYETLLNTDVKFEQENIAALMKMAVKYGRSIGFTGDFYIEPKPKEPMKHQYDFDAATAIGFLRYYGLDKDFKMNIEANHATLAGHTFQHDLRISAINGMLGSIDANQGDYLLGWDTDEFPFNVYETTMCMYEVLKAGGLTGGFNFDAKNRRPSYTAEDMFHAYILGMDAFALGLIKAAKIIEDGRIDGFIAERYASYNSGIGAKIRAGETTLEELAAYADAMGAPALPGSGRQEYLEAVVNNILFFG